MITIQGSFHTIDKPVGYKDPGSFYIMLHSSKIPLLCVGAAPKLKKGTPLIVYGEYASEQETMFMVRDMEFDTSNPQYILQFFNGSHFRGLNKRKGQELLDALRVEAPAGDETWAELPEAVYEKIMNSLQISRDTAENLKRAIGGIKRRKELKCLLSNCRYTPKDIEVLYQMYGGEAYLKAKSDPYKGLAFGVSFALCDDLAFEQNIDRFDRRRVEAFLTRMCTVIAASGSCCMKLEEMMDTIRYMQNESKFPYLPKAFFLMAILKSKRFVIKKSRLYGIVVYPESLYRAEKEIVEQLNRLQHNAVSTEFTHCETTGNLDADQIKAMDFMKSEGIKILTGGPGAGKTTTIQKFIEEYQRIRPNDAISLCAPTGRAAVRITESCNGMYQAQTIHKLLNARMIGQDTQYGFNKTHQLPKGLYIVDEMSMVDELLFLNLIRALPDHSMVILSGDPDQLQSVQAGTVLKDLVISRKFEHVELTGNHRQGGGTSIVENYKKIKNRQTDLITDGDFRIVRVQNADEALKCLAYEYCENRNLSPLDCQILTSAKVGKLGKTHINSLISEAHIKYAEKKDILPQSGYCVGDKIMMTWNNYGKHYWNGDVGIITRVYGNELEAMFYDGIRRIDRESMADMDHAFAMTIHKSQGTEYDTVIVILGQEYSFMLCNALLLTAATRAKRKAVVITVGDAMERAILTDQDTMRITGLADMLMESWEDEQETLPDACSVPIIREIVS